MPATTIEIPSFEFSSFYYPQILEALIAFKRRNVPELTDESAFEPSIQLLRAFALVGHLNNVLIDLAANESTLPTAKLTETVRNMLRLIDFEMRAATPAQVDIVYELSKVFAAPFEVISEAAQAATRAGVSPAIPFEALTALTIDRTDQHSAVFGEEASVFTDFTAKANSPTTPADDWSPWTTPAVKDAIYWGHKQAMWDTLSVLLTTPAANIVGVFEFFDGDFRKVAPTSVADLGGSLEFDLTSLLGTTNRQGTQIRVQLNETTAFEDVESTWNGSENIATTALLGQSSPSTTATDYSIGSDWSILEDAVDAPVNFTLDGKIEFPIPQTLAQDWKQTTINGINAFWLRYRIVDVTGPTAPVIQRTRMDEGKQFVLRSATQGQTFTETLGSSTGLANQRFETSKNFFVFGSETITVDGDTWTRVDNFLASKASNQHYRIELGADDRADVIFGDGVAGRIPAIGVNNIVATYRHNAEIDGNVGANTVTIDKTGLTFTNSVTNPRPGSGWTEAQGASEESLERAKVEGPASLRIKEVAVGPDDVSSLAVSFVDSDGSSPFSRATAFEEGFGPKTVELIVVAAGGALASTAQLAAIEEFFNGDKFAVPPKEKHLVANQEVTAVNYTPRLIDITATVFGDVEEEEVENQLRRILQPEALKDDGVTFEWVFGAIVPTSRINHEIFKTDESITDVDIAVPAADVPLQPRELPTAGAISITVVKP